MALKDKMNILPGVLKSLLDTNGPGKQNLSSKLDQLLNDEAQEDNWDRMDTSASYSPVSGLGGSPDYRASSSPIAVQAQQYANAIMETADRHCSNGSLTVNEMRTFLSRTPFEPFLEWLTGDRLRYFRQFDTDRDGALSMPELQESVEEYLSQPGPGLMQQSRSLHRSNSPSQSAVDDLEKDQLKFLVKNLSHQFHTQLQKSRQMEQQLAKVPGMLRAQRSLVREAFDERDHLHKELAHTQNEVEELKGMLERMKLARGYQLTAREVADKALSLAGLIGEGEDGDRKRLKEMLESQNKENERLREIVHSMTQMRA